MYKSLYRRYRPVDFSQVVGQENVVSTIKTQIKQEKVGHAYLFIGSRGTGKTTVSKILARALNCEAPIENGPCNQCATCLSALSDALMDITELDAASNNGVDDIRDLRENTKFPPSQGKYKVIIIDEVHMLSKGAFNALLKTLEEPPSYIVFILATTEPNKLPATIISRCQRFEFKKITESDISNHLKSILENDGHSYDLEAIHYISRLSEGGLRDALSLLEQCLSFSPQHLSLQSVFDLVGTPENFVYKSIIVNMLTGDVKGLIQTLKDLHDAGTESIAFLKNLLDYLQGLMHYQLTQHSDLITPEAFLEIQEASNKGLNLGKITAFMDGLILTEYAIKNSSFPWIILEANLVKLSIIEDVPKIHDVVPKIQSPAQSAVERVVPNRSEAQTSQTPLITETSHLDLSPDSIDLEKVLSQWETYLLAIKKHLVSTFALMREVKPIAYENGLLKLYLNENLRILKTAIENNDNMRIIKESFYEVFSVRVNVTIVDQMESGEEERKVKQYFSDLLDPSKIVVK